MSLEARAAVANSPHIIYRSFEQRNDIARTNGVQTQLIAMLEYLVGHGAIIEVTALKSDHSDDTTDCHTGPPYCGTHAHGWSVDCWPLLVATPYEQRQESDYMDAGDPRFQHFLRLVAQGPYLHQIGLGGSAYADADILASGSTCFRDDGEDHVHIGTQST